MARINESAVLHNLFLISNILGTLQKSYFSFNPVECQNVSVADFTNVPMNVPWTVKRMIFQNKTLSFWTHQWKIIQKAVQLIQRKRNLSVIIVRNPITLSGYAEKGLRWKPPKSDSLRENKTNMILSTSTKLLENTECWAGGVLCRQWCKLSCVDRKYFTNFQQPRWMLHKLMTVVAANRGK